MQTTITLTEEQARLVHAVLCDALTLTRDRQAFWLGQHEALATSSPTTSANAWQAFKKWEKREGQACDVAQQIEASGVALQFCDFGLNRHA